jgi:DNA-binding FadR family transcriptional regulator
MMLQRVDRPEREEATERLRAFIAERGCASGDRLPAERELIDLLEVGRAALRRGLDQLEREGVIWRHVGKGTFVSNGAGAKDDLRDPLVGIGQQLTPFKLMRARITFEAALAREAALHASRDAVAQITLALKRGRAAASWSEYERQDDRFHRAIAETSDNALLLALFDGLNRVRREISLGTVTRTSARPPADHPSFAQHEQIAAAIANREPDEASLAMRRHLHSVASRLFGEA